MLSKYNYRSTSTKLDFSVKGGKKLESLGALAQDLGINSSQIKITKQVHGTNVAIIKNLDQDYMDVEADAIITTNANIIVGILTGDCVPLFITNPKNKIVAGVHVSRATAEKGILENVLAELKQFDSNWSNYEVWLGPSLQQKSHLVDLQFLKFFDSKYIKPLPKGQFVVDNQELFKSYLTRNNYIEADLKNIQSGYLDLHQYIKDKLVEHGFNISKILDSGIDTYTNQNHHSYRRDYPNYGIMLSYAILE